MEKKDRRILYQGAFLTLRRGFVILAAFLLAGSWLSFTFIGDMDERQDNFADVKLISLDGKEQADAAIFTQSPITVVNIWATFCSPCIREMPEFEEISKEYADRGVRFIGICGDIVYDENGEPSAALLADAFEVLAVTGAAYPQYMPTQDSYGTVRALASNGFPYTYILDAQEKVCKVFIGGVSKEKLVEAIDWQLGQ